MRKSNRNQIGLVGVVHLPALPGAPKSKDRNLDKIIQRAVNEAKLLEDSGFDAIIIENFGDVPFYKDHVPAITVSAMSVIASRVREAVKLAIGINVLRNDVHSALAIASVCDCQFIRVNVLSGVAATDQGMIEADAASLLRERAHLERATGRKVDIWADALVKHAKSLSVSDIDLAIEEVALRSMADAVIVTGATTGRAVDLEIVKSAARHRHSTPIYLGSGVTPENLESYVDFVQGAIVGSSLRKDSKAGAVLEKRRVEKFVHAWKKLR